MKYIKFKQYILYYRSSKKKENYKALTILKIRAGSWEEVGLV